MKEKLTPMTAIGRISNPFMYEATLCQPNRPYDLESLSECLTEKAREGWKLHTIESRGDGFYFCVWEKLDYGEAKK